MSAAAALPDAPAADLQPLLAPKGIAVIGASADANKLNGRTVKALVDRGYAGLICPVNPKYETICGQRCYPDVASLPPGIDLAVIITPTETVVPTLRAMRGKGIGAAIVFSAGFSETGAAGAALEDEMRRVAQENGIRLLGPNCLGLINAFDKVIATFSYFAQSDIPAGSLGFVSQSGAFGTTTATLARQRGLHLGYFANTGNEADLGFSEVMAGVLADPRIQTAAGYIEGLRNGASFQQAAGMALAQDKPLIVTKVGRTGSGARAVASHTGALAGEDRVFDAVARQYGVTRARNEEQLLDFIETLSISAVPRGRRIGIVTRSGGAGALLADRADELGLMLAQFTPETKARLAEIVPSFGSTANPVDVTAQGVVNPNMLRDSLLAVLADPGVDIGVLWLAFSGDDADRLVDGFADIRRQTDKPFVISWVGASPAVHERMRKAGVPLLRGPEPAIDALHALVRQAEVRSARRADTAELAAQPAPAPLALPPVAGVVDTATAAKLLLDAGVPLAPVELARSGAEAAAIGERLGFPVALKIESPDLPHKTEVDGVRLGLKDGGAAAAAFESVVASARRLAPSARITGVTVQPMARPGVELVVGVKRDPVFGPVVMVGLGGILIEVLGDVALRHAPIGEAEAHRMLNELRGSVVLDGVRGKPAVDRAAIARLVAKVSQFAAAAGDRLLELDLNPVIAGPDGAVAVDCLMVLADEEGR